MTKAEKAKLGALITHQRALRNEILEQNAKNLDDFDTVELRRFDQHYGECIGIEKALALLAIEFKSVDGR